MLLAEVEGGSDDIVQASHAARRVQSFEWQRVALLGSVRWTIADLAPSFLAQISWVPLDIASRPSSLSLLSLCSLCLCVQTDSSPVFAVPTIDCIFPSLVLSLSCTLRLHHHRTVCGKSLASSTGPRLPLLSSTLPLNHELIAHYYPHDPGLCPATTILARQSSCCVLTPHPNLATYSATLCRHYPSPAATFRLVFLRAKILQPHPPGFLPAPQIPPQPRYLALFWKTGFRLRQLVLFRTRPSVPSCATRTTHESGFAPPCNSPTPSKRIMLS